MAEKEGLFGWRGSDKAPIQIAPAKKGGADESVQAFTPVLACLSSLRGSRTSYAKVRTAKRPPISLLRTDGVYLLDTGFELFVWTGRGASANESASAFSFAQNYLSIEKRPAHLPISRYTEGNESQHFLNEFSATAVNESGGGCCVIA